MFSWTVVLDVGTLEWREPGKLRKFFRLLIGSRVCCRTAIMNQWFIYTLQIFEMLESNLSFLDVSNFLPNTERKRGKKTS